MVQYQLINLSLYENVNFLLAFIDVLIRYFSHRPAVLNINSLLYIQSFAI
jgi:hypothetical protein